LGGGITSIVVAIAPRGHREKENQGGYPARSPIRSEENPAGHDGPRGGLEENEEIPTQVRPKTGEKDEDLDGLSQRQGVYWYFHKIRRGNSERSFTPRIDSKKSTRTKVIPIER